MASNKNPAALLNPTIPTGTVVATYHTYVEANEAVDKLAEASFPVDKVSIVGSDLKSIERVTGAMSWGRAALSGLGTGLWFGLFIGLLWLFWTPAGSNGGGYFLTALLMGAAFGLFLGLISYSATRRSQNFTSIKQVIATSYSLIAVPEVAGKAMQILGTGTSPTI